MKHSWKFIILSISFVIALSILSFLFFYLIYFIGLFAPQLYTLIWWFIQQVLLPCFHYFCCLFFYIGPFLHFYHTFFNYSSAIAQAKRAGKYEEEIYWRKQLKIFTWHFIFCMCWSFLELNGIINFKEVVMSLKI